MSQILKIIGHYLFVIQHIRTSHVKSTLQSSSPSKMLYNIARNI